MRNNSITFTTLIPETTDDFYVIFVSITLLTRYERKVLVLSAVIPANIYTGIVLFLVPCATTISTSTWLWYIPEHTLLYILENGLNLHSLSRLTSTINQ